jgi:trigger factor
VRRGLTIAAAVEAAAVTDTDGAVIDTTEFFGKRDQPGAAEDGETDEADDGDEHAAAVEATASSEE